MLRLMLRNLARGCGLLQVISPYFTGISAWFLDFVVSANGLAKIAQPDCKTVYTSSILVVASISRSRRRHRVAAAESRLRANEALGQIRGRLISSRRTSLRETESAA